MEVLRRSTAYLQGTEIDSPRFEAELLMAAALGVGRLDLYLEFDRPLDEAELERVRGLLRQKVRGSPTAYLLGEREFFGLRFKVGPGALVPRPETELLVELALAAVDQGAARCADLGSGTGCIGVTLAVRRPNLVVDAVDLSATAVELTRENIQSHGVGERAFAFAGWWAEPLRGRGPYQLVVSNPPYVTTAEYLTLDRSVRDFEPREALDGGVDGLDCYRQLLPSVGPILAPGATLLLEGDPRRLGEVADLCRLAWPGSTITLKPDLAQRERVVEVQT
ncbi:MAG TPA: peptide chain release factor N(5)-glutamine methyltransferase [Candidatus Dormibacteraeota bacterium]